ncbi:hypothetical protein UPYG_G00009210 [Umbra pygmaea]|uniref:Uncharacterized protein n=1 Tax=Umbra pygmaea TaxID=75934 RepID=A0ABD0XI64_UMBPY
MGKGNLYTQEGNQHNTGQNRWDITSVNILQTFFVVGFELKSQEHWIFCYSKLSSLDVLGRDRALRESYPSPAKASSY